MTIQQLLSMPKDELRVMIAECAGFIKIREQDYSPTHTDPYTESPLQYWVGLNPKTEETECIPDYPNSLDAMIPLIQSLKTQDEKVHFLNTLRKLIGIEKIKDESSNLIVSDFDLLSATARLRTVAYVATRMKL